MNNRKYQGFTLIELLAALALIAILIVAIGLMSRGCSAAKPRKSSAPSIQRAKTCADLIDEIGDDEARLLRAFLGPAVTISDLNVRRGPGTHHHKIDLIPKGTKLVIDMNEGHWLRIRLPDKKGWVHGAYVRPMDFEEAVPVYFSTLQLAFGFIFPGSTWKVRLLAFLVSLLISFVVAVASRDSDAAGLMVVGAQLFYYAFCNMGRFHMLSSHGLWIFFFTLLFYSVASAFTITAIIRNNY